MEKGLFSLHQSASKKLIFLVLLPLLLSSCAGLIRTEQPSVEEGVVLSQTQSVGQTFVAKYDGLEGIGFYLSMRTPGSGQIRLHLRSEPPAESDLAVSSTILTINEIENPGYYSFDFPIQASSTQKYYYAFLEVTGDGEIQLGKAAADSYMNGALYRNGQPADAQAAFQLTYSQRSALLGLGSEAVSWAGILVLGIFLFMLPGWGLFCLLWPGWGKLKWPEKIGLSAGLSLAIYPLLLLWTDIIGLHLGAVYAWLPPMTGLCLILWRNRKQFASLPSKLSHFHFRINSNPIWPDIVFLIVLALLAFTRFWTIRSLDVPMWGDSYQHTMIAQLLVEHGGLFSSWQPYADLATFTYHFGFHSAVAVFDWIARQTMTEAVLWVGQLLNIMAVIVLYPLAVKIGRNRWAGVIAVLVAGLLSQMPNFYVNWGRYTQLTGQVILPVAAWVIWNAIVPPSDISQPQDRKRKNAFAGMMIICCLALGGLALTHYRVLILAIIFLVCLWIIYARRGTIRSLLIRTVWLGIGSGLLFLPWFIRLFGGRIMKILAHQLATSATRALETDPQLQSIGNIANYLPPILWLVLILVIGLGFWRRDKGILLTSLWWCGNFLAANPFWLGLPGAGAVTSFTVFIATYIPAGILAGAAACWLIDRKITATNFLPKIQPALSIAAAILLIAVGVLGARQRMRDLQPSTYALATRPDLLASAWLQENTAPDARLLINSFPAFRDYVIVGSDGGWWLPLLARRQTTVPPINYGFEKDPRPGYREQINALTLEIRAKKIQNPDILLQLKDNGISYIYIGQLQGMVNSGGPLFTAEQLLADPNYKLVYQQDRVWIFKIQRTP